MVESATNSSESSAEPEAPLSDDSLLPASRLRFRYLAALAVVASLTIGTQVYLQNMIGSRSNDGHVINVAGRQRMLSQKLAKCAVILRGTGDTSEQLRATAEMQQVLKTWTEAHQWLRTGNDTTRYPSLQLAFEDLQPSFDAISTAAKKILAGELSQQEIDKQAAEILNNESKFLPRMNRIVGVLDADAAAHVKNLKNTELCLLTITLSVLLLEGLLVFEPAARTISRQFKLSADARKEAERSNRSKSQFLANMSHELRTPLNGVIGMLDLLQSTSLDDKQHGYARICQNSAMSLLEIINDILDYSKIEASQMELEKTPFDLSRMLEEVASLGASQAVDNDVEVVLHYSAELPQGVVGDPLRLRQVLTNLLNNALKFTNEGHVILATKLKRQTKAGLLINFAVQDTGIGIAPDKVDKIFEKFTQADGSTTRKFGGTGLGLAIANHLVELMGGEIKVESTLGVGSSFSFQIVLPAANLELAPETFVALEDARVLVVDDLNVNREILVGQLDSHVQSVTAVDSASQALELLKQGSAAFDLVVTDYQMPGIDGIEFGRLVRQEVSLAEIPLVMLSSNCRNVAYQELDEIGFFECLVKPASKSSLLSTLNAALHTGSPTEVTNDLERDGNPMCQTIRVLVAEDHKINQLVARRTLEKLGCEVQMCDNGQQAVDLASEQDFDLIFMDCHMPKMNGYDATREIRKFVGSRGEVPIVALSANALVGDRELSLEAGMNEHISKPFRPMELAEVLRTFTGQSHVREMS